MNPDIEKVRALLGKAAQEVGGRVIARIDGRAREIVTASGVLTEHGARLLSTAKGEKPAARRGRPAKAKPEADLVEDLRNLGLGDAEDEGGEDE